MAKELRVVRCGHNGQAAHSTLRIGNLLRSVKQEVPCVSGRLFTGEAEVVKRLLSCLAGNSIVLDAGVEADALLVGEGLQVLFGRSNPISR